MAKGALSGLTVLEYAQGIPGPYCARMLGSLGAEVIKVEDPAGGDMARTWGPFPDHNPHPDQSGLFIYLNLNKKGISLSFKTATGRRLFKELAQQVDFLIESTPPSFLPRRGLGYTALRKLNPQLIMTSITPFGQTGPYRDWKADDLVSTHIGGLGYAFSGPVTDPEAVPPLKVGGHQADFATAVTATIDTLAALNERRLSGQGSHVDFGAMEALAAVRKGELAAYSFEGTVTSRTQTILRRTTGLLKCRDGFVQMHGTTEREWQGLVAAMARPELLQDERFKNENLRSENWGVLKPIIEEWTAPRTKHEAARTMQAAHLAFAPINTPPEVLASEQLAARGFFVEVNQPGLGRLKLPGAPFKLSATPWQAPLPAPTLGQHNQEILCGRLGLPKGELPGLRAAGVI
ncbi:MAG: CoA transferase [Chloroflexi bacterium]|nr:CoA transferase [Chloroflexota bacterium]